MPSRTGRCPLWCARIHSADTSGAAFYHASETLSVAVSRPGDPELSDRFDVQAAQYLPDDPAEPAWPPAIEIAMHAAGRYRLIGLTPPQARELAGALARAADMLTTLAPGSSEEQDEPAPARRRRLTAQWWTSRCLGREAVTLPESSGRDVVLDLLRDQLGDLGDTYVGVHAHAFTLPGGNDIEVPTRYVVYLFKRICHSLHPVDGA